ncbi:MAG TPA: D-alanyl-D-alanine carboxypeptidase/D-alanyl-D-alanine-endopeptidase [Gemmatimonadota bacterium]|nr:D-alanyl-D-alanine carboxypeptidase/D-alanyl-D-alanine-endopeptidase [Gemmatimonadota bacterium]
MLLSLLLSLPACTPRSIRGSSGPSLVESIARAVADPSLAHSGIAILVVSLDRGDTLFAREQDRLYTPASNRKLFTAASALHWLGPDYRFSTALLTTGPVAGDTLRGDLVLVGHGDPDLAVAHLAALVDSLAATGARVVTGDVRADDSWFDDVEWGAGWMWDDGPYWEWPYITALTLADNVVTVTARPGPQAGAPAVVSLDPPTAYMTVRATATTGAAGSGSNVEIDRHWHPRENVIDVSGTVALGGEPVIESRTVEDPALYAVTVLEELLAARGIEVLGVARHGALDGAPADTVAVHESAPLAASIRNFLKISDNLTGELLVKAVGAHVSGPPGTYEKGLAAERAFLAREVGTDTTAQRLADGSGVSRYNLVTARQIVELLAYMASRDDLYPFYLEALPVAGVDGTLEGRMRGTAAEGRARAKSGTLNGVAALSGYVPAADGERLAFSTMIEFYAGGSSPRRAVQDSIVAALARFRR